MVLRRLSGLTLLAIVASLIVIRTASGSGSDEMVDLNSLSEADLKTVTVRLERMGCYGSCPVYAVTIHGDGSVEYVGKNFVKVAGAQKGRVEIATIRNMLSEFARAKFLSLAEDHSQTNCTGRLCTDMATVITELSVRGVTHVVKHYYGCGSSPKALFDLESAVDKSANTVQWTGDVSKQGPYGTTCWGA